MCHSFEISRIVMESINNFILKIKNLLRSLNRRDDIVIVIVIVLVGFGGFGLGRLSKIEEGRGPAILDYGKSETPNTRAKLGTGQANSKLQNSNSQTATVITAKEKLYVASVKGSRYHFPWCSGAGRIKEENKLWFSSKEEAEKAGYTPAKNCKGL